jgi:hypothetical protein
LQRHLICDRGDRIRFQVAYFYLLDATIFLEHQFRNAGPKLLAQAKDEGEREASLDVLADLMGLIDVLHDALKRTGDALDKALKLPRSL